MRNCHVPPLETRRSDAAAVDHPRLDRLPGGGRRAVRWSTARRPAPAEGVGGAASRRRSTQLTAPRHPSRRFGAPGGATAPRAGSPGWTRRKPGPFTRSSRPRGPLPGPSLSVPASGKGAPAMAGGHPLPRAHQGRRKYCPPNRSPALRPPRHAGAVRELRLAAGGRPALLPGVRRAARDGQRLPPQRSAAPGSRRRRRPERARRARAPAPQRAATSCTARRNRRAAAGDRRRRSDRALGFRLGTRAGATGRPSAAPAPTARARLKKPSRGTGRRPRRAGRGASDAARRHRSRRRSKAAKAARPPRARSASERSRPKNSRVSGAQAS